jgi:hypothetical protein
MKVDSFPVGTTPYEKYQASILEGSAGGSSLRKELYYQQIAQPQHPFETFEFIPNSLSSFYPKSV